ncbi:MAG: IMP dehydrogenase [Deltaproteobacteria bacterium]|nr:IMP dehydrogenase [Deltaproteobacteria bacterium]
MPSPHSAPQPPSSTPSPASAQDRPQTLITPERVERLNELRAEAWKLQNPLTQLQVLEAATREFAKANYAQHPAALQQIMQTLDYIFENSNSVSARFTVPQRIEQLLAASPCVFSMYPGLGTHESLSQYDLVLAGRYSKVNSRREIDLSSTLTRSPNSKISIPLCVAKMRATIGGELAELMIEEGLIPILHRFKRPLNPSDVDTLSPTVQSQADADAEKLAWVGKFGEKAYFSCGNRADSVEFAKQLIQRGAAGIFIDVAIGNSEATCATALALKEFIEQGGYSTQLLAGNVDTAEGYFMLALCGVDAIAVGIGPGSPCTTRIVTRSGSGQGSALLEVGTARFMMGSNAPTIIADGGIEGSGDLLFVLAAGANAAMVGKLAARTEESGALKRVMAGKDGKEALHAWYFGEASQWARLYEQGGVQKGMGVEGKGGWIPVSGGFRDLLQEMHGGLVNALPYYNAASIPELQGKFSPPQQLCDLILGGKTGMNKSASGTSLESNTRLS